MVCNEVIDRFVAGELNQICASRRRTSAILGPPNHRALWNAETIWGRSRRVPIGVGMVLR